MWMRRDLVMALIILALGYPPSPVHARGGGKPAQPSDTTSAHSTAADSAPSPGVISVDPAASDSARVRLLTPYWYYKPAAATTLAFHSRPGLDSGRMPGFESYRASRAECAFQGAAIGSTIGMNIAALGLMTGAWEQKEAWIIGGALTTLGTIYGGIFRADDPKWYNKIRIGVSSGK